MHSGEAAKRAAEVAGQAGEQPAVYQKRRRRELMERSFAHGYNRRHEAQPLRGHKNILRWQLIHVGGFNPSLMRQLTGAGTRREWKNRVACLFGSFSCYSRAPESRVWLSSSRISMSRAKYSANARSRT